MMLPETTLPETTGKTPKKTTTIASVVDVVGALANDSTKGSVYFMDTNKANGSTEQGTENLKTVVSQGDRLVWTVTFLECEAYAEIQDIIIDKSFCEPKKEVYEGTDVSYWVGIVKQDVTYVPYSIKFKLGTRAEPIATEASLSLIGKPG